MTPANQSGPSNSPPSRLPPPCDAEIFKHGRTVTILHTIPAWKMENIVRAASAASGHKMDWHYLGGRPEVLTLGNISLCKQALDNELAKQGE